MYLCTYVCMYYVHVRLVEIMHKILGILIADGIPEITGNNLGIIEEYSGIRKIFYKLTNTVNEEKSNKDIRMYTTYGCSYSVTMRVLIRVI